MLASTESDLVIQTWRWMEQLEDSIAESAIVDMTLLGSHDSTSFDSSSTLVRDAFETKDMRFSRWATTGLIWVSSLLFGSFSKDMAVTQTLSLEQQLNAGVRFLDFRACVGLDGEWRSWHGVQTTQTAGELLGSVDKWLRSNT